MSGIFNTRPRFQDRDMKQMSGDTMTLSGDTIITGNLAYNNKVTIGHVLTAIDNEGNVSWASVSAVTPGMFWTSGSTNLENIIASNVTGVDATGQYAVAWGASNLASGYASTAMGINTNSTGVTSTSMGRTTVAGGASSLSHGRDTKAYGPQSHAEGQNTTASGEASHAEGDSTVASGGTSHAEGNGSIAAGEASHSEGLLTVASGDYAHSEGSGTLASGVSSHAEGTTTTASGQGSHAEGTLTFAKASYSHAEGIATSATTNYSHSEGITTLANGESSHAEGDGTTSAGQASHAEGVDTQTNSNYSHTEGDGTETNGLGSHAEGLSTVTYGNYAHSEGSGTMAGISSTVGIASHASGLGTIAYEDYQTVMGRYNTTGNTNQYLIVGRGTSSAARANAFRVDSAGEIYGAGATYNSGADYAEYFESVDGSSIPFGTVVELDNGKVKECTDPNNAIGVVSSKPSMVGNCEDGTSDEWVGKYIKDVWGNYIYEDYEYDVDVYVGENGEEIFVTKEGKRRVLNKEFDPSTPYQPRKERDEWNVVGLLGQIRILKNQQIPSRWIKIKDINNDIAIYLVR